MTAAGLHDAVQKSLLVIFVFSYQFFYIYY